MSKRYAVKNLREIDEELHVPGAIMGARYEGETYPEYRVRLVEHCDSPAHDKAPLPVWKIEILDSAGDVDDTTCWKQDCLVPYV